MEKRRRSRGRAFLGARIRRGTLSDDCQVRDISEDGAKLKVDTCVAVPDVFHLVIPMRNQTFECRVTWRSEHEVGVSFTRTGNAPIDRERYTEAMADLAAEIFDLRAENARLRAIVAPALATTAPPAAGD